MKTAGGSLKFLILLLPMINFIIRIGVGVDVGVTSDQQTLNVENRHCQPQSNTFSSLTSFRSPSNYIHEFILAKTITLKKFCENEKNLCELKNFYKIFSDSQSFIGETLWLTVSNKKIRQKYKIRLKIIFFMKNIV